MGKEIITKYLVRVLITCLILSVISLVGFIWFDWVIVAKVIGSIFVIGVFTIAGLAWSTKQTED